MTQSSETWDFHSWLEDHSWLSTLQLYISETSPYSWFQDWSWKANLPQLLLFPTSFLLASNRFCSPSFYDNFHISDSFIYCCLVTTVGLESSQLVPYGRWQMGIITLQLVLAGHYTLTQFWFIIEVPQLVNDRNSWLGQELSAHQTWRL